MRKYKKFTALSMSALLMAGVMAGCGGFCRQHFYRKNIRQPNGSKVQPGGIK